MQSDIKQEFDPRIVSWSIAVKKNSCVIVHDQLKGSEHPFEATLMLFQRSSDLRNLSSILVNSENGDYVANDSVILCSSDINSSKHNDGAVTT